jgi:hypothetical protein
LKISVNAFSKKNEKKKWAEQNTHMWEPNKLIVKSSHVKEMKERSSEQPTAAKRGK